MAVDAAVAAAVTAAAVKLFEPIRNGSVDSGSAAVLPALLAGMRALALILLFGATVAAAGSVPLALAPVYRLKPIGNKERFVAAGDYEFKKLQRDLEGIAFLAVCTNNWPAGLVPIFAVERTNRVELRRRPARGRRIRPGRFFMRCRPWMNPKQ